jgi:hypothetical protein
MTDELIPKTPAQHVAALVKAGPGLQQGEDDSLIKRFMVRLPINTVAFVEAIAEHGGRSRNFMIGQLLIVGCQAVIDELPEAERDQVQLAWLRKIDELATEEAE